MRGDGGRKPTQERNVRRMVRRRPAVGMTRTVSLECGWARRVAWLGECGGSFGELRRVSDDGRRSGYIESPFMPKPARVVLSMYPNARTMARKMRMLREKR